jgi:hypothetical protein
MVFAHREILVKLQPNNHPYVPPFASKIWFSDFSVQTHKLFTSACLRFCFSAHVATFELHVENDGKHMFRFEILTHFSAVCNVFLNVILEIQGGLLQLSRTSGMSFYDVSLKGRTVQRDGDTPINADRNFDG